MPYIYYCHNLNLLGSNIFIYTILFFSRSSVDEPPSKRFKSGKGINKVKGISFLYCNWYYILEIIPFYYFFLYIVEGEEGMTNKEADLTNDSRAASTVISFFDKEVPTIYIY